MNIWQAVGVVWSFRKFLKAVLICAALMKSEGALAQDTVTITFLFTNDLHGIARGADGPEWLKLGPTQGLLRIATMIDAVRAENPNTIVMDTGDLLHGTPMMYINKGEPMAALMNAAGYDVRTLGNHDFEWGLAAAAGHVRHSNQDFVVANMKFPDGYDFGKVRPYVVREAAGVKIAFTGLMTHEVFDFVWPEYLKGVEVTEPASALAELMPEMRREADFVVALSHLGASSDRKLALAAPGADLIIGGHSHNVVFPPAEVGKAKLVNTGSHGRNLGRIDVDFARDAEGRMRPVEFRAKMMPVDDSVGESPELAAIYDGYKAKIDLELGREVAQSWATAGMAEAAAAATATREIPTEWPVVAKMLNDYTGADAAVVDRNLLGLPGGGATGPVRVVDLYAVMRAYSRQNVIVAKLSGAQLQSIADRAAAGDDQAAKLLFSGLSYETVPNESGMANAQYVTIGGKPLDPAGEYTIAATGSIFMDTITDYESLADPGVTLRDAVAEQLQQTQH